jgi:hypothetical protein
VERVGAEPISGSKQYGGKDVYFIIQAFILFFVGCLTDTIWVLYITNVTNKNRLKAANYSVLTGICGFAWLEGMMADKILVVFWLVGLWCGTYFAEQIESFVKRLLRVK